MNRDLRLGLILMGIFIALFLITFTFQSSGTMKTHTTAAFFPRVVLVLLMFLTLLFIIQSWRKGPAKAAGEKMEREKVRRVVVTMGLSVLYVLGVIYLGTLVSSALFIAAAMLTWGVRRKLTILLTAMLTPIMVYLVFTKILLVQLPSGIFK